MELFYILILVMVTRLYTSIKTHRPVHFKTLLSFTTCKIYLVSKMKEILATKR